MTTPTPQRWLPGWFYFPNEEHERFAGRRTDALPWDAAAEWLRRELHEGAPEWGEHPTETMHREPQPPYGILLFPGCIAFADHGIPLRRNQGVWASDGQRCFYIIREDAPGNAEETLRIEPVPPLQPAAVQ